ncbi:hypothetical protein WG901_13105 [Novosphingobium sp. PS1R-30]|uniref:Tyr recombinase domain-containing protein n=1 Tax=Novosphingobium anseongense TaxID=3133436 RepID=A0ABU8RX24_9SPHN
MTFKRLANDHIDSLLMENRSVGLWWEEWETLKDFQITPLSRVCDPIWRIPSEWAAAGDRRDHMLTVDFTKIHSGVGDDRIFDAATRRIQRHCVVNAVMTVRYQGRTLNPPAPGTWIKMCQLMLPVTRYLVASVGMQESVFISEGELELFGGLSPEKLSEIMSLFPSCFHLWVPRLNAFLANGVISDWPAPDVEKPLFKPRKGDHASMPFSDQALTQILSAALWLNDIHGDVLSAYIETKDVGIYSSERRRHSEQYRARRVAVAEWKSESMRPGVRFPYGLLLAGARKEKSVKTEWPPETVSGLRRLVFLCQVARLIIILFATGQRIGEAAALPPDCLSAVDDSKVLNGFRFKDVDATQGEARSWPFPQAAVRAIENQLDLLKRLGSGGETLWRSFGGRAIDSGLLKTEHAVLSFGRSVTMLDGTPLEQLDGPTTCHRFRYSIARLIGLALAGAPQVLYDVLGHAEIETTMGYQLRSPEFHDMVNQIRLEVKAVQIKEAVLGHETNGGRGADLVGTVMRRLLPSYAPDALETDDIENAVKILGDAEVVRPGVLCLAQPLERGACSSSLGIRDVGACTPGCTHRLEQSALRQDRRNKLSYLIRTAEAASGGSLVFYQGQLLSCLEAFPDLLPEVEDKGLRNALRGCTPATWSGSRQEVRDRLTRLFGNSL